MNNQDAESSAPEIELDNRLIYIEPSDSNEKLPITRRAARLSIYLRDVLDLNDQQAFHDSPGKKSSNSRSILTDNCDSIVTIPLRNQSCCNLNTMKNIIRWCEYHCDDPKLITNNREDSIDEDDGGGATGAGSSVLGGVDQRRKVLDELPSYWDRRFLSDIVGDEDPNLGWSKRADLYDLLIAAHFLQIQPIVEIGGKFICSTIKDKSIEQVRNFLGITNDLDDDDEFRNIVADSDWSFNR
ncbi:E3 ubiquitin ligase complex SCF subunit sconC [Sarcoptes scabiei]|uniref:E3 ubiquitin ligase complex SCF subunit sconC n=1 Tax=Sarcoptes scabiei TaxID=52283 RepID=A0A834RA46_SARSC|nr:E3 ubiquitin ligase complex SCF subunit sconC [Sarcoptes scabiei]UXI19238.1 hypothetical protein NH340_JMT05181 [Sarcoptes scabiei]